ncbi:hypothetical protein DFH08DRAFT_819380 [Mycena albidolilacea]|uniref:Uncharacterized protein n=1 Tax=Mycena albidolilacea TaxID=1033008 RepID=A0AAD6ZDZ4_9AGAR|nr:hypothetical protein DFH08DRAFT_819380 [Mycena albidolilacea]
MCKQSSARNWQAGKRASDGGHPAAAWVFAKYRNNQWVASTTKSTYLLPSTSRLRLDFYQEGLGIFDREFVQKPNCLMSHYPGGLNALLKDLRVGPIVPEDPRAGNVCGLKGSHFRN